MYRCFVHALNYYIIELAWKHCEDLMPIAAAEMKCLKGVYDKCHQTRTVTV